MAKRKKKARVNFSKIRGIMYIMISILFVLALINKFNTIIVKANKNIYALEVKRDAVQEKAEDLNEELALLDDENYVTTYAREHYVFKADDETVAKISTEGNDE